MPKRILLAEQLNPHRQIRTARSAQYWERRILDCQYTATRLAKPLKGLTKKGLAKERSANPPELARRLYELTA